MSHSSSPSNLRATSSGPQFHRSPSDKHANTETQSSRDLDTAHIGTGAISSPPARSGLLLTDLNWYVSP
jgi:hypothetical protein